MKRMKRMKRIICLLLMILFVFGTVSCGKNSSADGTTSAGVTETTEDTTETSEETAEKTKTAEDNRIVIIRELSENGEVSSCEECPEIEGYDDIVSYWTLTSENGHDIDLTFYLPADFQSGKLPAMICEPLNISEDHERFAEAAEKGIAVILVFAGRDPAWDFAGDSDLDYIKTAVDLVYGCDFIDGERIMLFGTKEHSICVLRYISENYQDRKPVKAAAVVDPIHDMYKYYDGLNDEWKERFKDEHYTHGSPEEVPEEFEKRSPGLRAENIDVPLYIAYFDLPDDGEVVNGIKKNGILDISYYEEYINKLKSLGKDVTAVHYDTIAVDLDHDQFLDMADWFIGLK